LSTQKDAGTPRGTKFAPDHSSTAGQHNYVIVEDGVVKVWSNASGNDIPAKYRAKNYRVAPAVPAMAEPMPAAGTNVFGTTTDNSAIAEHPAVKAAVEGLVAAILSASSV